MTDLDIIKECRQTGKTRTSTKNLLEKAYYEQMTNEIDISTVLIEGDTATIMGVKYQRIIERQSFYNKLWGLLKTKLGDTCGCDEMADKVRDLIRENIPEPYDDLKFGVSEWFLGYNECVKRIKNNLK
jgi:hypothetical protein